ncbi:MAG: esterase family protein [Deltaproteobacteria bacterium]|nr:MAG: esterase family protein [Deltaproteobacteria bacterium]
MSARTLAALALIGIAAAFAAPASAVCDPARCRDVVVPLPSGVYVPDSTVRVLLPADYAEHPTARYPVLYLLHGAGDTYKTWTQNTDVESFTAPLPLIVVMPDAGHNGSPPNEAGWYTDWKDGSRQWEKFHIDVLIPYIEANYRTLGAGHRAVAGLSMGGFGAMSYAARHPGLFRAAASFSGAVDTQYAAPASGVGFATLQSQFGTPGPGVWGDQLTDQATWTEHNPKARAADLAGTELFVATGTGTPGGPAGDDPGNPGGYALEAFIFQMNVSFASALAQAGVPFQQDFYAGGYHGWPYWQRELHWALPQMLPLIGVPTQPFKVMNYNVLHGQPCNGGSYPTEVAGRMEFAVQGGPNREPGLAELAPDLLGNRQRSDHRQSGVSRRQSAARAQRDHTVRAPGRCDPAPPERRHEHARRRERHRELGVADEREPLLDALRARQPARGGVRAGHSDRARRADPLGPRRRTGQHRARARHDLEVRDPASHRAQPLVRRGARRDARAHPRDDPRARRGHRREEGLRLLRHPPHHDGRRLAADDRDGRQRDRVHPREPAQPGEPRVLRLRLQRDAGFDRAPDVRGRRVRRQLRACQPERARLHLRARRPLERLQSDRDGADRLRLGDPRRPGPRARRALEPGGDGLLPPPQRDVVPVAVGSQRRAVDLRPPGARELRGARITRARGKCFRGTPLRRSRRVGRRAEAPSARARTARSACRDTRASSRAARRSSRGCASRGSAARGSHRWGDRAVRRVAAASRARPERTRTARLRPRAGTPPRTGCRARPGPSGRASR